MITTTWTAPSADLLGTGSADVRTAGWVMAGPAAPFQGTGVSAAGPEAAAFGIAAKHTAVPAGRNRWMSHAQTRVQGVRGVPPRGRPV